MDHPRAYAIIDHESLCVFSSAFSTGQPTHQGKYSSNTRENITNETIKKFPKIVCD